MGTKQIHLLAFRSSPAQRSHFALYFPHDALNFPGRGLMINVVGAPMAGFKLEIEQDYDPESAAQKYRSILLGNLQEDKIGQLLGIANNLDPPKKSRNFLEAVDGIHNRRCQEWTADYVSILVKDDILTQDAFDKLQAWRDPPSHGIGLKPVNQ